MKRRLPTATNTSALYPALGESNDADQREGSALNLHASATEKRRVSCQIHPLYDDPLLLTLTPRSLAKSVAELDALRSRVHELELKLSRHEVEALPPAVTPCKSRLPPIQQEMNTNSESSMGESRSVADLKMNLMKVSSPGLGLDRITTAPDLYGHKSIASASSPSRKVLAPVAHADLSENNLPGHQRGACKAEPTPPTTPAVPDPPSPTYLVMSTSSLHREQAKISLDQDGETSLAISRRQKLYQILKRVSALIALSDDDLLLLKKLVDAEIGDVIAFLLDSERLDDPAVLDEKLKYLLQNGSPPIQKSRLGFQLELSRRHSVWSIQYPLQKVARNLEQLGASRVSGAVTGTASSPSKSKTDVIVLVSSGAYNPIHMLHMRAFYVARQYVESNYKFPVVGAFISPSHDTFVRVKNRRNPHEMITKRHRLGLIEAAVAGSSWIEVDKWEITRRRVLDYLSTLTHVREMCESHFARFKFHVVYVCGCNTVVKLSHSALRDEGFGCITVCRPTQTHMVMKHLGRTLTKSTTIVEDTGVLPVELERATSFRARQTMSSVAASSQAATNKQLASLEMMVGKPALQYMIKHSIPGKVAGKEPWNEEDKAWRRSDLTYVEYIEG